MGMKKRYMMAIETVKNMAVAMLEATEGNPDKCSERIRLVIRFMQLTGELKNKIPA